MVHVNSCLFHPWIVRNDEKKEELKESLEILTYTIKAICKRFHFRLLKQRFQDEIFYIFQQFKIKRTSLLELMIGNFSKTRFYKS